MSRPIERLAFVTDATAFGGAERYILDMARAAVRRGIQPEIIWFPRALALLDFLDAAQQDHLRLHMADPQAVRSRRGFVREFRRLAKSCRPDAMIVNAAGRPRFWLSCWLARSAGTPAAWVHHMVEQRDPRREPPRWFGGRVEGPQWWRVPQALRHRLAAAAAAAVITSNPGDRDRVARWQGLSRREVLVIPPGVDCTRCRFNPNVRERLRKQWLPAPASGPVAEPLVVGTAARLVRRKGIEPLIEAMALLQGRGLPAMLLVAGDGPDRPEFERLAAARGVGECVRFLGFLGDMPAFYSALDVFALCSETESFGLVLAEAMACRRAVVSTPTAGGREQVEHLGSGWLLKGYDPAELADALAALHADAALRDRLGAEARTRATTHFSIEQTLERTLEALAAGRSAGASNR